jgi:hypothetical protein
MSQCSCLRYPACKLRLFRIVLYCHLWLVYLYHISYKQHGFREKIIEHKTCLDVRAVHFLDFNIFVRKMHNVC